MPTKSKVVVGMSGGVDSSVAAYLLQQQGYDVIGVTLKFWSDSCLARSHEKCCGPQSISDARLVAHRLGIPHFILDEAEAFEEEVISPFVEQYRRGLTPNPCALCNEKMKFGRLPRKASAWGAEYVATGHYARIERSERETRLKKAKDERKDQTYFLFRLERKTLDRMLTPLGDYSKEEVRDLARQAGLSIWDKEESQGICFIPGNQYETFLAERLGSGKEAAGEIVDLTGKLLGHHRGIESYTVGQRRGLPGGQGKPLYVVDIDPEKQRIVAGPWEALHRTHCYLIDTNWQQPVPMGPLPVTAKVRYNYPAAPAQLTLLPGRRARIDFVHPQAGVAPGQAAVCYIDDLLLGGGWIERTADSPRWETAP
ncbi:tRNA-specific 2-thiouridylase MnmA [Methylacidimicrobium cyclopophantes]|uniref:tRNA-specific 2-thiouridylase MnmA n=1 Tax=Methylacidimicrobium cyclopophantes TaxID=1041766 RepID=A0A5E6MHM3_9BACT|nr:tRNA 2-thiouridine(34) synthase MnmA [Methylacidimicrobium cyclopophantes]VVM08526.1 tRNA-specific 2-thiouridylase MnmA [Methylacidimicrobium cyclopophantes]